MHSAESANGSREQQPFHDNPPHHRVAGDPEQIQVSSSESGSSLAEAPANVQANSAATQQSQKSETESDNLDVSAMEKNEPAMHRCNRKRQGEKGGRLAPRQLGDFLPWEKMISD